MLIAEKMWSRVGIKADRKENRKTKITEGYFSVVLLHIRRILVIALNTICGNFLFYSVLGLVNRLIPNRPIRSVFLFYSVNEAYLRTMIYSWYAPVVKWRPGLGQIIKQNGYWCLSFGVTANEKDYYEPKNQERIAKLRDDVDKIRRIIGAEQMTFSGVLPSIFVSRGIIKGSESVENKNTVKAIIKSIDKTQNIEQLPHDCPLIVLGARGFIGRKIVDYYLSLGRDVYSVDINDQFPTNLNRRRVIVLNITKKGAIKNYIPLFWPEVVLVNEVYPEPSQEEVGLLKEQNVNGYHIAGVKGFALPGFKNAYKGGIPCCASYLNNEKFEVTLTKLA